MMERNKSIVDRKFYIYYLRRFIHPKGEHTMKNIYFIFAITLFILLGACKSDENRACEILDELNTCWSGDLSTVDSCQGNLPDELASLDINLSQPETQRFEQATETMLNCFAQNLLSVVENKSLSAIEDVRQCMLTALQKIENIFSCK